MRTVSVAAWTAATISAAVCLLLPLTFPDGGGPTALDRNVANDIDDTRIPPTVLDVLAWPSTAAILLPLVLVVAAVLVVRARRAAACFVVLAPLSAIAVNGLVLKPAFGRQLHDYLAYPSGHTTSLVAVGTALAVVAAGVLRQVAIACTTIALMVAAVAMIGLGYHHFSDILGGAAAAIAIVLALAAFCAAAGWTVSDSNTRSGNSRRRSEVPATRAGGGNRGA